ncbi:hypothetical protein NI17_015155 [Thermobifida halotolerans]|uniref:Uncharacterized protein n=1 Tax=Thermobifida halotolerans TaxID=483545 RepID=A0AA97LU99_9ACTN|nr:hypothetical protein [Thermobifida halotolerans]UOE18180.1 hypothetical protein NI17_015155 [Thermobifida halotolerans]
MGTLSWITPHAPTTPAQAVAALHDHLSAAGLNRLYRASHRGVAVLSIRRGLTVWCVNGLFRWTDERGARLTHPAGDPEGASRRICDAVRGGRGLRSAA